MGLPSNVLIALRVWYFIARAVFGGFVALAFYPLRRRSTRLLRDSAVQLNEEAVREMDCDASSNRVRLPKANITLHVVEAGNRNGKLIVLLHGFPDTWNCWHVIMPKFVQEGYFVIAPDMRGFNLSDKPAGVSSYSMKNLTNDVKELISFYNKSKAVIVSHDWGGVVAYAFAERFPEMVEKLVVMNAPHNKAFMRELGQNPKQILGSWYIYFFQLPFLPEASFLSFPEATIRKIIRLKSAKLTDKEYKLAAAAIAQDGAPTAMINYYRALFRNVVISAISRKKSTGTARGKLTVPTLVLWGSADLALTAESGDASEYVKDFKIRYIQGCSHWVPYEATHIVVQEVLQFAASKL